MIDPSIITRGAERAQMQQQQNFESLGELGNSLGRLVLGRRINTLQQLGTPEEKQAYANKSIYAPQLNAQIKADNAAALQAQMVQQKHASDIENTNAQALERKANAGEVGQKTLINRQRAISGAMAAAMSGDPKAVSFMLEHGKLGGILDDSSYTQAKQFLAENANNPDAIGSLVKSLGVAAAEKPEQYIQPDANTVADNATSIKTTGMNNKTSEYVANSAAATAAAKLKQEGEQFKKNYEYTVQQDEIKNKQGEIKEFGGNAYIVYKNGDYRPLVDESGQPVKSQAQKPMSATTQKELFEVGDSIAAGSNAITNLRDALKYSANAYDGVGAIQRAKAMGHVSNDESARNTVLLDNIVSGNALEMLKATFGGAPTEGERKILLDLQGSANLPSDQREAIYTRAIAAAERRLAANEKKAEGLRDGSYFKPSQLQQSQVPSSGAGQKKPTSVVDAAASKYGF